jgi:hypothetical protein
MHQAARRWTSQTAAPMSSADSASSQPPSIQMSKLTWQNAQGVGNPAHVRSRGG